MLACYGERAVPITCMKQLLVCCRDGVAASASVVYYLGWLGCPTSPLWLQLTFSQSGSMGLDIMLQQGVHLSASTYCAHGVQRRVDPV